MVTPVAHDVLVRVVLVVVTAACAALAAGSGAAAPSSSQARDVSYLFHAQFDLDYGVDWVETGGDRLDDCAPWWDNRGSGSVSAGSLEWIPGQLRMAPGRTSGSLSRWALTATGARPQNGRVPPNARVEVTRRLVQRGGPVPGCPPPSTPFRAPQNDCGEVAYKTRTATLLGGLLKGTQTLETLLAQGGKIAIRVTVPPPRQLYRTCLTTPHAPQFPSGFPVTIRHGDVAALRNLKEGETHKILRDFAGDCIAGLSATSTCHYDLHITVKIRRWVSRVRCSTGWCPNRFP
jgi:hypothetical protein